MQSCSSPVPASAVPDSIYHCYRPIAGCGYRMPNEAGGQSLYNFGTLVRVSQPNRSGVFGFNHFIHMDVIS